ncbi:sugar transferase [Weissella confusa]|uniref:Sugar transferase n=1 Tax=Weissella confusa TaxID=1583 RepID=A0AA40YT34_WEICO|nr:sugar transferase [Weissella confusa]MBJ7639942.1 sugar transferase [Weissella confusa]
MYERFFKRAFDIVFATLLLIVFIIPIVIIGVTIKLSDSGTPFFVQKRYGRDDKQFSLIKFRTMRMGTPIVANSEFRDMDSYVTLLGKFFRETSLDEIPQIFNVIRGEMSFIGPRPLADTDYEVVKLRSKNGANNVRPGITGLAQVKGRNKLSNFEKSQFDGQYANNISLWLDVKIVFLTIFKVLKQENINK